MSAFAGPAGTFFSDGQRLFSSDAAGLSVWDVDAGELTARIEGFRPSRQHIQDRELVELRERSMRRWHY